MDSQMDQPTKTVVRTLTPEEYKQLIRGDDTDEILRQNKRDAQKEWNSLGNLKDFALRLGVKQVLAEISKSGIQGEYVDGTPDGWAMSERRSFAIEKNIPVIFIDIETAFPGSGIAETIAHEIGHHIDYLANGYPKSRKPTQKFVSAFKRAGFYEYSNTMSGLFSELIAETLGQYLRGHKMNAVLLTEVNKVLDKLSRKHQGIIETFRNKQLRKN